MENQKPAYHFVAETTMDKREIEHEMDESKRKDVESKTTPPINHDNSGDASAPKRTKFQIVMVMTALCVSSLALEINYGF